VGQTEGEKMHDNSDAAIAAAHTIIALEPVALPIETVPQATGLARTRIFEAVAKNELTARKAGKATIVEVAELRRFIRSLPTRGRSADAAGVVTT
jgi:hypothetical protein